MALGSPVEFAEALGYRDQKRVMPTGLGSAELAKLDVATRERSMFSARTLDEHYLEEIQSRVRRILNPETVADGTSALPRTEGMDFATARTELKGILQAIGYTPEPGEEGSIKDLSSDRRLNLVLETNVEMAQGFGQWKQGQDADLLELWPCQELFRAEEREEKRDWIRIWTEAALAVGDTGALAAVGHGRMVARKDSPIWTEISDFGQPYPPFKFNSGMWVRDVDRDEAVRLGVIKENDVVRPSYAAFEGEPVH